MRGASGRTNSTRRSSTGFSRSRLQSAYRPAPTGRGWQRCAVPGGKTSDPLALLDALNAERVEYIIVGGATAALHGAPVTTQDLDIVHRLTRPNVRRLKRVLDRLHATVREPEARNVTPDESHLLAPGQLRLLTDFGPLDVVGRLHDGRSYDDLLPQSELLRDGTRKLRVVNLPTLIDIKATTGRRRDQIVLPILRELLRRRR